jgi:colicin import membrane protein
MTRFSTPTLPLMLVAAFAVSATGCDRIWPSSTESASKIAAKASLPAPAPGSVMATMAPATASATTPPQPPLRMTLAEQADFDAWMIKAYLACWKPAAQPADADPYVAQVRLAFKPDGSLSMSPKLVNPPSNPALKPQAKSVMQAVQACNPLPVPAQYRPFYEQWKTKTIHFNPQIAAR